eukprot:2843717-Amphidinium_carterae.1
MRLVILYNPFTLVFRIFVVALSDYWNLKGCGFGKEGIASGATDGSVALQSSLCFTLACQLRLHNLRITS